MLDLLLDVEKICQRSGVTVLVDLIKPLQSSGNEALHCGRSFKFCVGEQNHYQQNIHTGNIKLSNNYREWLLLQSFSYMTHNSIS